MRPRIENVIRLARLAIGWEALWAALIPVLTGAALFAAVIFSGLLGLVSDLVRFALLVGFALGFLWSLRPLARLERPTRAEAMRRVERQSALSHRPVSGLDDTLADPAPDPLSSSLWEAHKLRQLKLLDRLKAGWPRPAVAGRDPHALRLVAGLALIVALVLQQGDARSNLRDAVRIAPSAPEVAVTLDAWIAPPAYTAKPPVMLTSPATQARLAQGGELIVPENSILTARVSNAGEPRIAFFALTDGAAAGAELAGETATVRKEGPSFKAEAKLTRPVHVKLFDGNRELASWRVMLLPDAAPSARFTGDPEPQDNGALALEWQASDDYGVAGIEAKIALSDTQDGEVGIAGNGVFLFEPPDFPIALKTAAPKQATGTSVNDLSEHPWAGLEVEIALEARDQAGQAGLSETRTARLPERRFEKLLARALIEQRKALVMQPDETEDVERMLDALLIYPEGLIEESGVHVAIAAVLSRLRNARDHDDIRSAIDLLWRIATGIEEGDLSGARAELEALRKQLQKALAEGASPERIAELMQKMREAMNRYMDEMAAKMQREMREGSRQGRDQRQMGEARQISREDLQKMLDQIENLSKSGANEAAQEMLAQLDQILKNLQMGMPQEMRSRQDGPMGQMLDELTEMMRRQQQLMDDTQRLPKDEPGEMGEQQDGREPGSRGPRQPGAGNLADQQEALGRMLEEMLRSMGQQGMQSPPSLGEAGEAMKGAGESLRGQERGRALGQQGEALDRLREGAQSMARRMMQDQGTGSAGNQGRHGEARGDDRDPLGRPMPSTGEDLGPERNMLPSELAIRRAREILDMLRSRANTPDLPKLDRDYLERLLRGLY